MLITLITSLLLSAQPIISQNYDEIPIFLPTPIPPGTHHPNSQSPYCSTGYYDLVSNVLVLYFNESNLSGTVQISVSNGEYYEETFNTDWGIIEIPMSGNPGVYSITLSLENVGLTGTQFVLF